MSPCFLLELTQLLMMLCWHLVLFLSGIPLQLNLSFESAMGSAGLLPFGMSGLVDKGNLHTWCWCSVVDVVAKEGDNYTKILLILVWMHPDCSDCCGQFSHLMSFNKYQTFDPGSRHWYHYSIRFLRIIWYLTCQATYFSQFHAIICRCLESWLSFWYCCVDIVGSNHLEWMALNPPLPSLLDLCCLKYW